MIQSELDPHIWVNESIIKIGKILLRQDLRTIHYILQGGVEFSDLLPHQQKRIKLLLRNTGIKL